jgi:hypothetical protein
MLVPRHPPMVSLQRFVLLIALLTSPASLPAIHAEDRSATSMIQHGAEDARRLSSLTDCPLELQRLGLA